ncbi:hypothetical protein [Mycolicibacterium insubricum]|uniref:hypothetical protein n=1 Tax=Mycolicibacterium insubricum TaxID=444597 RepID=UPI0021F2B65C|nr:hypothetical protein [Mycolicibacterium insubricum]MCV7083546.1 hypothetical protein [Mycolicibacterium insubricum]
MALVAMLASAAWLTGTAALLPLVAVLVPWAIVVALVLAATVAARSVSPGPSSR